MTKQEVNIMLNTKLYCYKLGTEISFKSVSHCLTCNNYNLCFNIIVGQNLGSNLKNQEEVVKIVDMVKKL